MPTDTTAEFSAFCAAIARERYLNRSGRKSASELRVVFDRFGDLFRPDEIATLDKTAAEAFYERDRMANRMLAAATSEWFVEARVCELSDEIAAHELRATAAPDGAEVDVRSLPGRIAREERADVRARLFARWADALAETNDLRAEALEKRSESARILGARSELDLIRTRRGVNYSELARRGASLLASTEREYLEAFEPAVTSCTGVRLNAATLADAWFALGGIEFDRAFLAARCPVVYRDVLAGLGIRSGAQRAITLDLATRPGQSPDVFCAALDVPREIVISGPAGGGVAACSGLLRAAGEAQQHAFTAPDVRVAFARAGDGATPMLFGHLLARLLVDEIALAELFAVPNARAVRALTRLRSVFETRCEAALLAYAVDATDREGIPAASAEGFEETMRSALHVRVPGRLHLHAIARAAEAGKSLRARAAEVVLREHLRVRFGRRWWQRRAAGDLLKELWATGSEYSAEQVTVECGLEQPSLDVLETDVREELLA